MAGGVFKERDITVEATDSERLESMRDALFQLWRLTGNCYGYDLAGWHGFLTAGKDEFGYRHPYAWRTVKKAIERFIVDPERLRLVAILVESGETSSEAIATSLGERERVSRASKLNWANERWNGITSRTCPQCGGFCPEYKKTCAVCGFQIGRVSTQHEDSIITELNSRLSPHFPPDESS